MKKPKWAKVKWGQRYDLQHLFKKIKIPGVLKIRRNSRSYIQIFMSCPIKSRFCTEPKPRWVDLRYAKRHQDVPGRCRPCGLFKNGYITPQGYVVEGAGIKGRERSVHRFVMTQMLGRKLKASETVHHKNGDRSDNRKRNLELWSKNHGAGQRVRDLRSYLQTIPRKLGGLK